MVTMMSHKNIHQGGYDIYLILNTLKSGQLFQNNTIYPIERHFRLHITSYQKSCFLQIQILLSANAGLTY